MEDTPDLGLHNLWRILRERLWIALLVASLTFAGLAWFIFSLRPAYTAQAVVLLAPMTEELDVSPDGRTAMTDPFFIRSETAIIASDQLARGVIASLNLTRSPEFTRDGAPPESASHGFLSADEVAMDRVLTDYRQRLEVFNDGRSKTVTIAFTASNPRLAALIANAHADAYLVEQSSRRSDSRRKSLQWLKQEVDARAREARDADALVQQYQLQHGIVTTQNTTVVEQRLGQLSSQLVDARRELSTQTTKLEEIESLRAGGDPSNAATLLDNAPLADLLRSRVQAEADLASLQTRLVANHPTLVKQQQTLASINEVLDRQLRRAESEAQTAQSAWQRQVAELSREVAAETSNKLTQDRASAALPALAAEAQVKRTVFETVLNRYQTQLAEQGYSEPTAAVVSHASPPSRASFPRIPLFLVVALLGAALAGVGAALLTHLMRRARVNLPALADQLGTRALAVIPRFRNDARADGEVRIRDPRLYIESIRSLRNAIFEQPAARDVRVCLFTSVAPSEGKTLVAMSVARSLARSGVRALFLEMDLRCPTASKLARRTDVTRGVGTVLEGRAQLADVICRDADTGLDMLFAEKSGGLSLDRLTAQAVAGMLARLRSRYDVIIADSPPVGVICDSLTLAGVSDQTVLVMREGETTPAEIAIAVRMLRDRGASLGGIVLTDADPRHLQLSRRTVSRYVMDAPPRISLVKSA